MLSDPGASLIERVANFAVGKTDPNKALNELRKHCHSERARLLWDMALLRQRAKSKFGSDAAKMFFTRDGLEMASGAGPAAYHASRFKALGRTHVIDLCCGIGGDTIAFARAGMAVTMVDINPLHLEYAAASAKALGLSSQITAVQGDASAPELIADLAKAHPAAGIWFDPARRSSGSKRTVRPEDYVPPLSLLTAIGSYHFPVVGVKLAPAIEHSVGFEYGANLEFLSHEGECKEGLLWVVDGRSYRSSPSAVVLSRDDIFALDAVPNIQLSEEQAPSTGYLFEPDPAVIRAHLVKQLAVDLNASLIDPQIAYVIGPDPKLSVFSECYPIMEKFSYSRRTLQDVINRHNVGRLIVKKRGVPVEPEDVISQVKLKSGPERIVVITREGSTRVAYLCEKPLTAETISKGHA